MRLLRSTQWWGQEDWKQWWQLGASEGEAINRPKTGKFLRSQWRSRVSRSGVSLRLIITMRGLTGLILCLAFYSFKCYSFSEVSNTRSFKILSKHNISSWLKGSCGYACNRDGSCTTTWIGPPRSGGHSASCFSPRFGGSCFGHVDGCRDCNEVL